MFILLCGLPRAGKTTYSKKYDSSYQIVHTDMCGMHQTKIYVAQTKGDIVVDGVYKGAKERADLCRTYSGNYKKCIWLNTSKKVRMKRANYSRHCDYPFEPPTYDEGWDEIIIIEDNNDESISNTK